MSRVAAVDIGATSGRVVAAELKSGVIGLTQISRFPNRLQQMSDRWTWDIDALYAHVLEGLRAAGRVGSWGIDTWAVDYAVVRDETLVGPVYAYRDERHQLGMDRVEAVLPWPVLYAITGIQRMSINTINQIAADEPQRLGADSIFLMVPDLLSWWATGEFGTDVTNASSTGMVDPRTRQWSSQILRALDIPEAAFVATSEPGQIRGTTRAEGLVGLPLVAVATHDTASAFVGTPLTDRDAALVVSLGTWALIGAEVIGAVPTQESRALNLTHELGADGTVRVLRNVCGMWLLEECRRTWLENGEEADIESLMALAVRAPAFAAVFDVDAPILASPGQSPTSIAAHFDRPWDGSRGAMVRAILESLVVRLAQRARQIEELLRTPRPVIHVVGGACRIEPLMQWLADATGKQVIAGPVEATAIGNAVVQWRTLGELGSMAEARGIIAGLPEIRIYDPAGSREPWLEVEARLQG